MSAPTAEQIKAAAIGMHKAGNALTGETLAWEMLHPHSRQYLLDMAEAALIAAAADSSADDWFRLLALTVIAAGGRIEVPDRLVVSTGDDIELRTWREQENHITVIAAGSPAATAVPGDEL